MRLIVLSLAVAFVALAAQAAPPTINSQPEGQTNILGGDAVFIVDATGGDDSELTYQWRKNGVTLNDTMDGRIFGATDSYLFISGVIINDAGNYSVTVKDEVSGQTTTSANAYLRVLVAPTITQQPVDKTAVAGNSATFTVKASGTTPLRYQWYVDAALIPIGTNASLTLTNVQPEDDGKEVFVIVSNDAVDYGADEVASEPATLTVLIPPTITDQPDSVVAVQGDYVLFSVGVEGTDTEMSPMTYQWRFKGNNLIGETDSLLEVLDVQPSDAGAYSVVVANGADLATTRTVTSSNANLTVNTPPVFTLNPQSRTVTAGSNWTVTARATGTAPLAYQWLFNGSPIPGATSTNYTFFVASTSQSGRYWVIASNLVDEVESLEGILTVKGETVKPTVRFTYPAENARWSNSVITVRGVAADNALLNFVEYDYINAPAAGSFQRATSGFTNLNPYTEIWTNWTATYAPTAGTNLVRAVATDDSGNRSTTASLHFFYVVPSLFTLVTNGVGSMSTNLGQYLEVGRGYSLTAKPGVGFTFMNWSGDYSSTNVTLKFKMQTNLTLAANFVDVQKPTVTVTNPLPNGRISNAVALAKGKASDNAQVAEVRYQLNGGEWTNAVGTSNWVGQVEMVPGTNGFRVFSVDTTGNYSTTNSQNIVYVLSGVMTVATNGNGTVTPNYNGQLLEIGKSHTMTAKPGTGFAFTGWTGTYSTNNNATNKFLMESNLVAVANFVDVQKPTVTVTNPLPNGRISNAVALVKGKASDNARVAEVRYQLNGGEWTNAVGTSNWVGQVEMVPGTNGFRVYSVDPTGNYSTTNSQNIIYVLSGVMTVATNGSGTVTPNYNGQLLELGKSYTMTAKPGTGFVFTGWSGTYSTNNATNKFLMESNLVAVANFVDVQKPTVTVTNPLPNGRISNAVASVRGRAADNAQVAEVRYQVNGGEWTNAVGTNSWAGQVELVPGTNGFRVYSVDTTGNYSTTNSQNIIYVLSGVMTVATSGNGTVTPNYNGQLLELGKSYTMTAKAGTGFVFTGWSGTYSTNNATNKFLMESNLMAVANFVDVQKPTVTVTNPLPNGRISNAVASVRGRAADNAQVAAVRYQMNDGPWDVANGTSNWAATVTLGPGTNVFRVYSVDTTGNVSSTNTTTRSIILLQPRATDIVQSGMTARVSFTSVTGMIYNLEYNLTPGAASWTPLSLLATGTGGILMLTDTNASSASRYYRIRGR